MTMPIKKVSTAQALVKPAAKTARRKPAVKTDTESTLVQKTLKVLEATLSLTPRPKAKLPFGTPEELKKKNLGKQTRLARALDLVWERGVQAGKDAAVRAPIKGTAIAKVEPVKDTIASDAERIGRMLLDPKVATTKIILMVQLARASRAVR
jgi:hypothetical protein